MTSPSTEPVAPGTAQPPSRYRFTHKLPPHLADWQLPPEWSWGSIGIAGEHRHYQEIVDGLGRSLSLVTAPDPAHHPWLAAEARHLAHLGHPAIPTTFHYWARYSDGKRGPGYLRRWIPGETIITRVRRAGPDDIPAALQLLRAVGSALAYLHSAGGVHGAVSAETVWITPTGRLWLLGWEWALPRAEIPAGLVPDTTTMPVPPDWPAGT